MDRLVSGLLGTGGCRRLSTGWGSDDVPADGGSEGGWLRGGVGSAVPVGRSLEGVWWRFFRVAGRETSDPFARVPACGGWRCTAEVPGGMRRQAVIHSECDLRHIQFSMTVYQRQPEALRGNHCVSLWNWDSRSVKPRRLAEPGSGFTVRTLAGVTGRRIRGPSGCARVDSTENTVRQNAFSADSCRRPPGVPGWRRASAREAAVAGRMVWRASGPDGRAPSTAAFITEIRGRQTPQCADSWTRRRGIPVLTSSGERGGHA